jgi:hypothetical protein
MDARGTIRQELRRSRVADWRPDNPEACRTLERLWDSLDRAERTRMGERGFLTLVWQELRQRGQHAIFEEYLGFGFEPEAPTLNPQYMAVREAAHQLDLGVDLDTGLTQAGVDILTLIRDVCFDNSPEGEDVRRLLLTTLLIECVTRGKSANLQTVIERAQARYA